MKPQISELLAKLEVQVIAEKESFARLMQQKSLTEFTPEEQESMSQRMNAIGPETGKFLNLLLKTQGGKHIGSVLDLWKRSNGSTKLIAIDEQPNNGVVQPDGALHNGI